MCNLGSPKELFRVVLMLYVLCILLFEGVMDVCLVECCALLCYCVFSVVVHECVCCDFVCCLLHFLSNIGNFCQQADQIDYCRILVIFLQIYHLLCKVKVFQKFSHSVSKNYKANFLPLLKF